MEPFAALDTVSFGALADESAHAPDMALADSHGKAPGRGQFLSLGHAQCMGRELFP